MDQYRHLQKERTPLRKHAKSAFYMKLSLAIRGKRLGYVVVVARLCVELVFDPLKRATSFLDLLVNDNKVGNSCWNLKQIERAPFCIKDAHQKHHKVGHSREQHDHKQCHACHSSMRSLVLVCSFLNSPLLFALATLAALPAAGFFEMHELVLSCVPVFAACL